MTENPANFHYVYILQSNTNAAGNMMFYGPNQQCAGKSKKQIPNLPYEKFCFAKSR